MVPSSSARAAWFRHHPQPPYRRENTVVKAVATPSAQESASVLQDGMGGELHDSVAAGDTNAVELLLMSGLDIEAQNANASTPLHVAALRGQRAVAQTLLDHGAATDAVNKDGNTPLHEAVLHGETQVAQLLLSSGAQVDATSGAGLQPLALAAQQGDSEMVTALLEGGAEMDEETAQAAFMAAVKQVEATGEDEALSTDVPRLLHHVFDADMRHLLRREKLTTNLTCMQPEDRGVEGVGAAMTYIFDDTAHADLKLSPGRKCEGGSCCDACSRNTFPSFALPSETDEEVFPRLNQFSFNDLKAASFGTILMFVRLIERVRRTIAHEYGLPLATLLPLQAYSRKYVAGTSQQGGGGGEGDSVILHTDEATHASYHYSCVIYLSTMHEDFEGGAFLFNDPKPKGAEEAEEAVAEVTTGGGDWVVEGVEEGAEEPTVDATTVMRAGRVISPFEPVKGAAVIFSSGWENMHEVEPLISGTRYAVPCFFTTCPVPEAAYGQVGGIPSDDEAVADGLQLLLLDYFGRDENPMVSSGRVKELLMKWHYLLAPGRE